MPGRLNRRLRRSVGTVPQSAPAVWSPGAARLYTAKARLEWSGQVYIVFGRTTKLSTATFQALVPSSSRARSSSSPSWSESSTRNANGGSFLDD